MPGWLWNSSAIDLYKGMTITLSCLLSAPYGASNTHKNRNEITYGHKTE